MKASSFAAALLIAASCSAPVFAAEVEPSGVDQKSEVVTFAETGGIDALHGIKELKGADLALVGVDIAPNRGFAIMRDSPLGPGLSADQNGFQIGGKAVTSFVGIDPNAAGAATPNAAAGGIPGVSIPGLSAVPVLNLPVVGGLMNMR